MSIRKMVFTACLLLAGCAAVPSPSTLGDTQAMIAPKIVFTVPPPSVLNQTVSVAQSITAHFKEQLFSFDAQIQLTPGELDLAALDGFGRRGLTVAWKPDGIVSQPAPWLPKFIRPADILADIALVYWPREALADSLLASGATLTQTESGRTVSANGRDLVVVEYGPGKDWNRPAKLRNLAFGYEIDIQSAEIAR
jgi:hypothetical protein